MVAYTVDMESDGNLRHRLACTISAVGWRRSVSKVSRMATRAPVARNPADRSLAAISLP